MMPIAALALSSNPDDQFYRAGDQWALSGNAGSTNAPEAWCGSTGAGILIADIDTGADFSHPDLARKLVVGARFTSGNAIPGPNPQPDGTSQASVTDDYGHGTLTAGVMVADTDNGMGIASEAPGARVLVIKVFSQTSDGYGANESDIAAGIYWAVEHGARVINLSLGPRLPEPGPVAAARGDEVPGAVEWASSQNVAVAISAGNGFDNLGVTAPGTPANYPQLAPYALVVGAVGPGDVRASYSQSGSGVNIFAPGGDGSDGDPQQTILSTAMPQGAHLGANYAAGPGGNYGAYEGTSFSAPYAAGTLALLMARNPNAAAARDRIISTAKRSRDGLPVLDAAAAVGGCAAPVGGGASTGAAGGASASAGARPEPGRTGGPASSPAATPSPAAATSLSEATSPSRARASQAAGAGRGFPWWIVLIAAVAAAGAGGGWYFRRLRT
jgi:serine protease